MLILDTEMENRDEYLTASQLLQRWTGRLWAWLGRSSKPESAREHPAHEVLARECLSHEVLVREGPVDTQDCGTGLIL